MTSEMKTVEGVEIFAAGTWTDSQGQERQWTEADLDTLLKNFRADSKESPLPVKVGHTDDSFNERIADELGIPNGLLTGDEGNGAARLGYISNVRKNGSTLVADFEDVPDVLTRMIESGFYNAVSVEIDMPEDEDPHLSGVAILGAELPAVDSLKALDTASIFANAKHPWVTLSFQEGEAVQIDPEELAQEFSDIKEKFEEIIRGKRGARLFRNLWALMADKVSGMTGKKFSSANWDSIIESSRTSTLTLPLETVATLCPDCGSMMGSKGLTKLKIKNYELPDQLKQAIVSAIGEDKESFFARCMQMDIGSDGAERMSFCAYLMKEYMGEYPTLTNDGGVEQTEQSEESNHSDADFQPPQLVNWAVGVSFDECVRQLSEPEKGISDPAAVCATLKRAAGELQAPEFNQEEVMNEFALAPEDLPRVYEALGLAEDATIDDVLAAIMALKGEEAPMPEGEMPPMEMPMSEEQPNRESEIAALKTQLEQQAQQIESLSGYTKNLEREKMVISYSKKAAEWTNIPGKPEELGEELAQVHEESGAKAAERLISMYQALNGQGEQMGITQSIGATHRIDSEVVDAFQEEVEQYAEKHDMPFNKALTVFAESKPSEFAAYNRRVKAALVGGK